MWDQERATDMAFRFITSGAEADIFTGRADAIINTVNCVGAMGKGLAKSFADRFPAIVPPYKEACATGALKPGVLLETAVDPKTGAIDPNGSLRILNFPTKNDWREPSRIEWIDQGLVALSDWLTANPQVRSIALPPLGCGLGGLNWAEVAPLIQTRLAPHAAKVDIRLLGPDPARARTATQTRQDPILEFSGENRIYSNMYPAPVMWGDEITPPRLWPCNEVAYVCAKTKDAGLREQILKIYNEQVDPEAGAKAVKNFGRRGFQAHEGWNDSFRVAIMEELVRDKFARNPLLRAKLLATGNCEIQEGNWWKDTFFGVSTRDYPEHGIRKGDGRNELGKIIMRTRDWLRTELAAGNTFADAAPKETKSMTSVINLKTVRRSARDPLPADVLDISRYGTATFTDGTKLGNPFVMTSVGGKDGSREDVIRKHAIKFANDLKKPGFPEWIAGLAAGKRLGCFCAPEACHGHTMKAAVDAIVAGRDPIEAIRPFTELGLQKPAEAPTTSLREYAGIGSRDTPEHILERMRAIGKLLAEQGWKLRSGGADGADINFERGCDDAKGKKIIFLPWKNFEARVEKQKTGYVPVRAAGEVNVGVTEAARNMASQYHGKWNQLPDSHRTLHSRNCYQVLDRDLKTPVTAVVCWTEGGQLKGGTAQALKIAVAHGIKIFNLGSDQWRDATPEQIVAAMRELQPKAIVETQTPAKTEQPAAKAAPAKPVAPVKNALLMR